MENEKVELAPRFQGLRVWKCAIDLVTVVYRTTEGFPTPERFGLTAQLRRSAVSVAANIAEGQGRSSPRASSAFVDISLGSLRELQALASITHSLGFLRDEELAAISAEVQKTAPLLVRLLTRLREKGRNEVDRH